MEKNLDPSINLDLHVDLEGCALLLYDQPVLEELEWCEYSSHTNSLYLVTKEGDSLKTGLQMTEHVVERLSLVEELQFVLQLGKDFIAVEKLPMVMN